MLENPPPIPLYTGRVIIKSQIFIKIKILIYLCGCLKGCIELLYTFCLYIYVYRGRFILKTFAGMRFYDTAMLHYWKSKCNNFKLTRAAALCTQCIGHIYKKVERPRQEYVKPHNHELHKFPQSTDIYDSTCSMWHLLAIAYRWYLQIARGRDADARLQQICRTFFLSFPCFLAIFLFLF